MHQGPSHYQPHILNVSDDLVSYRLLHCRLCKLVDNVLCVCSPIKQSILVHVKIGRQTETRLL